ncbi:MAG: preprotein translocase subunit SecA [Candidatus Ryanbacteria bacterium RIFCSPHIGHO2_02_FULL_48_12]|uniref:Protein translocase subunit SecA n=1 Tax=Candidatus Ryanbacteria bacterium RIFCSPHIGHO2_01_FULL_48_27 TaxID=1802115 RepID=A0A1G2G5B8_9BACT|nr:MAG: preprotein translocase subunit SecA [Candidatus Ryanbacteria bacterium RIFCSPHIGHO2_01_FULL_48_27]OGZ50392.1 MAG: preprotein translocase subunit SecA [Candidatus Ryanbacteria bacterium RIFCSPHIGHO2_02_FULL_48_12]
MSIFTSLFGDGNQRFLKSLYPLVEKVNDLEAEVFGLSDEALREKSLELKSRLESGEDLDAILPEAFALCRESARRTLGQRHFDVQLLGGMVLHKGQIAEMRTGEGKTLTATLPVYLNALTGKGVHVVTVNDYLARRDAVWMGQVYHALGLRVGCINHESSFIYDPEFKHAEEREDAARDTIGSFKVEDAFLRPCTRTEAYAADITYGTNNEYGFDYLRDNMAYTSEQMSQRGHYFAIVDEVDSILIDESRTPLIISAPDEESADLYKVFAGLVPKLKESADYNVDEKMRAVTLTEEGIEKVESLLGVQDIYTEKGIRYVRHLEQALKAQTLFHKDKDYVVRDGEIVIVDEFTGRLMPGRRWSEGLHQAVEAKESVVVQRESRTLASITFQNYFRLYDKLAGMTGTAQTSAEEFNKVYNLEVTTIPTNKPLVRQDHSDHIYQSEEGKFKAVIKKVKECHEKGQPILVGTISIEKNELLSAMLKREGVPHQVLNAKQHEAEAGTLAQAGHYGGVTIATNMAGRGVDIVLGGNPPTPEEAEKVRAAGGLFVLGTERHEARRIDDQLRGRAGRQGDPGESQFYVSLEDELMRVFGSDKIKRLMGSFGIPEDEPIENRMVSKSIESAQFKIEGFHFDARKHVLEYDDVMNKQREAIYRMRKDMLRAAPDDLKEKVWEMLSGQVRHIITAHVASKRPDEWNIEEIVENLQAANIVIPNIHQEFLAIRDAQKSEDAKIQEMEELAVRGARLLYEAKPGELGSEQFASSIRYLVLQTIDYLWIDHLEAMDYTRNSVRLRAYGQRDPLIEYKNEALRLFKDFNAAVANLVTLNVFKMGAVSSAHAPHMHTIESRPAGVSSFGEMSPQRSNAQSIPAQKGEEIGRNDLCPCGSGKKYKKCGMLNTEEHKKFMAK